MKYSRKQLKHSASDAIYVTRPRAGFVTLVYLLIAFAITAVLGAISPNPANLIAAPFTDAMEAVLEERFDSIDVDSIGDLPSVFFDETTQAFVIQQAVMEFFDEYDIDPMDQNAMAKLSTAIMSAGILLSLISWLIGLISKLITTILEYGYRAYTLSVFRHQKTSFGQLFSAFPRFGLIAGSWVMVGIFSFLWSLIPGVVGSVLLVICVIFLAESPALLPAVLILTIAMIVAPIILTNRYALTPYAILEQPGLGVFGCIRRSKQLMKGRSWNLFFLNLSFIGWRILIALACAIILGLGVLLSVLLFGLSFVGAGIAALLITLLLVIVIPIPATLWLQGYQTTAQSGFYHFTVTGNLRPTAREQAARSLSAEAAPADETPVEAAPSEEAPAGETAAEETPSENTAVGEISDPADS